MNSFNSLEAQLLPGPLFFVEIYWGCDKSSKTLKVMSNYLSKAPRGKYPSAAPLSLGDIVYILIAISLVLVIVTWSLQSEILDAVCTSLQVHN